MIECEPIDAARPHCAKCKRPLLNLNSHRRCTHTGAGDVIEQAIPPRFKAWADKLAKRLGRKDCGCAKRRRWLNRWLNWKGRPDETR